MELYYLMYQPDGTRTERALVDTEELPPEALAEFTSVFREGGLRPGEDFSLEGALPTDLGDISFTWASTKEGCARMTGATGGQVFLSAVLLSGQDEAVDQQQLSEFRAAVMPADAPNPFTDVLVIAERPLLITVTNPTLDEATYESIQGVDILLAAAFLSGG
jgi:hypothetical protein